jgi:HK97 family phage prohead protease
MSTLEQETETEGRESGLLRRTFAAEMTAGDGRTVDVRIVPYGERITHNDGLGDVPKGVHYDEEWLPGVFSHQMNAAHRVVANFEHQPGIGGIVGKGLSLREEQDGFHGSFRILPTQAGDTVLELLRDDDGPAVIDGVSLEARPVKSIKSGNVIQRAKANLYAIAFTRFSAFAGARVLAVREEAATTIDEGLLPVEPDPEMLERCRALGIALPQRYQAHPDEPDTSADADTSETAPATDATTTSEVEAR